MKNLLVKIGAKLLPILDVLLAPVTYLSAIWFLVIRAGGIDRARISKRIFLNVGVFPIRDHYYEPLFNASQIRFTNGQRNLPGFSLNTYEQLSLLSKFTYYKELALLPLNKPEHLQYYYNNPSFFAGDAEYLYCMIRHFKPRNIIEIGSGFSTLMMLEAVKKNQSEDTSYSCEIKCVEPYEMDWLESTGVKVIRKQVQHLDVSFFNSLGTSDILFIDSSHIIRPDGDVLFEYLEVLPVINSGVIVHIHDIYTPYDYPRENYEKHIVFINEQYLVEAFLSHNSQFKIIGAVNYLKQEYFSELSSRFPILESQPNKEPRSLWLKKI